VKKIFISGASSGIGKLLSEKLGEQGHELILASRSIEYNEKVPDAVLLKMDVSDKSAIDVSMAGINELDVAVINAGFPQFGFIETVSHEEMEYQFRVNVFGVIDQINAILPLMRKQGYGRIIVTASCVSHITIPGMGYYAASKHAVYALMTALRQELKSFNIKVIIIEPGPVNTGFEAMSEKLIRDTEIEDYQDKIKILRQGYPKGLGDGEGPEKTVKAMLHAINAKHPHKIYRPELSSKLIRLVTRFIDVGIVDYFVTAKYRK
jgi:short-subunit dehydrogenase